MYFAEIELFFNFENKCSLSTSAFNLNKNVFLKGKAALRILKCHSRYDDFKKIVLDQPNKCIDIKPTKILFNLPKYLFFPAKNAYRFNNLVFNQHFFWINKHFVESTKTGMN